MTTFISYSRRQLFFAESLALRLQQEGIDVWFDLQQLQAGQVWSEGLENGVGEAKQLVLVVSKASLESRFTRAEWTGVAERGRQVVLVVYEPVALPEELRGLPSYDFRGEFDSNLRHLAAFLKGNEEPRHDPVPVPNRLAISARLPGALWSILAALFGTAVACLAGLVLAVVSNTAEPGRAVGAGTPPLEARFFWVMAGLSLVLGTRYAVPLLHHKLEYKKVKRGVLLAVLLLVPGYFAVGTLADGKNMVPLYAVLAVLAFTLFVYLVALRRSADLLRWMQPEEALQRLRRRVHQPLVVKAKFDVDAAAQRQGKAFTYAIHADGADEPLVRFVERVFRKAGHTRVAADVDPEQHIAILSNRSSEAWAQEVTRSHAGSLVSIITSTIDFKESLAETGRYQWVDARDGDRRDIAALARSLGDPGAWRREAALETTPAMIDRWKVPGGITLLKRVMELFGIYLLVFGLTDLVGFVIDLFVDLPDESEGWIVRSIFLVVVGAACFWLASKALVYRKVTAPVVYGFLGGSVFLVSWLPVVLEKWGTVLPEFLNKPWWLAPTVLLPVLLYSALGGYSWLPASAKANPDEVGIKESIDRAFRRKSRIIVCAWVIVIVGIAVSILLGLKA